MANGGLWKRGQELGTCFAREPPFLPETAVHGPWQIVNRTIPPSLLPVPLCVVINPFAQREIDILGERIGIRKEGGRGGGGGNVGA